MFHFLINKRRVRNINCDVWAAPRSYKNISSVYEWYFMSNGWIVQEAGGVFNKFEFAKHTYITYICSFHRILNFSEPVMLKINFNVPTPTINVINS